VYSVIFGGLVQVENTEKSQYLNFIVNGLLSQANFLPDRNRL
jgi:hypothetical protein